MSPEHLAEVVADPFFRYCQGMLTLLLLQAITTALANSPSPPSAPLWRELRVGMTPEQAAVAIRSVEGVSEAEVRRDRRGRFRSLRIRYLASGVIVDGLRVEVQPVFLTERLQEVNLSGTACAGAATERAARLGAALRERYGQSVRERVVDSEGVDIEQRFAFWNEHTRVRMSWSVDAPLQSGGYYGGSGVPGALAGLANAFADANRDAAIQACPNDRGVKVVTTLNYSSQREFLRVHDEELREREERARATRDSL